MSTKGCEECEDEGMMVSGPMPQAQPKRIWVHTFNDQAAKDFCDAVLDAAEQDNSRTIIVYINSDGGEVDALNSMLGVMDSVPNPFVTVCTGRACSAGAILLSNGDTRFVGPYSHVMVHEISAGAIGHVADLVTTMEEYIKTNSALMALLARNTGKTVTEIKDFFHKKRDFYMSPKEAIDLGLADLVGVPHFSKQTTVAVNVAIGKSQNPKRQWDMYSRPEEVKPKKAKKKGKK